MRHYSFFRIFTRFTCFCFFLATIPLAFSASEPILKLSSTEASVDEPINLTFNLSNPQSSICAFQSDIQFDGEALHIDSVIFKQRQGTQFDWVRLSDNLIRIAAYNSNCLGIDSGDFATLKIMVDKNAQVGEYPLPIVSVIVSDNTATRVPTNAIAGKVVVKTNVISQPLPVPVTNLSWSPQKR